MRKTFRRSETNAHYWDRRWREAGADAGAFASLDIYPIKYARAVMRDPAERALEIGCGLGRVLKHYHYQGWNITGVERSHVAVERIRSGDPAIDIQEADAMALPFADATFDVILAFGLYHNLEHGVHQALAEARRVLRPGGRFCITMRPDNVEMRFNEYYWQWRNRGRKGPLQFHKWVVKEQEFATVLAQAGLRTREIHRARNMSTLYRVPFLRARRSSSETENRAAGYRLNRVGAFLDGILMERFSEHSCNVIVYVGERAA